MKHLTLIAALALLLPALPAGAQQSQPQGGLSTADCQEMFKAADVDNNGSLSRDELASSEDLKDFYAADENVTNVPLSKFVTDCSG